MLDRFQEADNNVKNNISNLSSKDSFNRKFAKDGIKNSKNFNYKSMAIAFLMKTIHVNYPELNDLTREEKKIVFMQARPPLEPALKKKAGFYFKS